MLQMRASLSLHTCLAIQFISLSKEEHPLKCKLSCSSSDSLFTFLYEKASPQFLTVSGNALGTSLQDVYHFLRLVVFIENSLTRCQARKEDILRTDLKITMEERAYKALMVR